jgi:hypothetical protein
VHRSTDVNSVTGLALHEHSHFTAQIDFVGGTVTVNGAINIMQRPGVGSVILNSGRKIFDSETGLPLVLRGPDRADDEDFCRALAPRSLIVFSALCSGAPLRVILGLS